MGRSMYGKNVYVSPPMTAIGVARTWNPDGMM